MRIPYSYPNGHLKNRFEKEFGPKFEIDPLEPITELIQRMVDVLGEKSINKLSDLLSTGTFEVPDFGTDLDEWLTWVEDEYIPSEPSLLSPGAMSNAPDRFDGFHSFNLCCRKKADTGRHDKNMRTYNTDRRVFEYWSEGDWIAADRLMGLVNAKFRDEPCADGRDEPSTADHIGPLSLGFDHKPQFRLLSGPANSAKNNRMTLWDVNHLRETEKEGEEIISWYAKPLWNLRKNDVSNKETALRLSKLLRDNHRNAMFLLGKLLEEGYLSFLTTLLELNYAEYNIEFKNLRIENFITIYDEIDKTPRKTKYAKEQKARRLRIGFESLRNYGTKENRHLFEISNKKTEKLSQRVLDTLSQAPEHIQELDQALYSLLIDVEERPSESAIRDITDDIPSPEIEEFKSAKSILTEIMKEIGQALSSMWESDRYVRAEFDFDGD
jgi:Alw26I/Eco31I/Esp3I family type II restriction endonuclease